jgi:hypothetical protein
VRSGTTFDYIFVALVGNLQRALKPGGLALFAITEHFDESSILPNLAEISPAFREVTTRNVGDRRVTSFHMIRQPEGLYIPFRLEYAKPLRTAESIDCYYQSHYRLRALCRAG